MREDQARPRPRPRPLSLTPPPSHTRTRTARMHPYTRCRPEAGWFGLPIKDYNSYTNNLVDPDPRYMAVSNWTAKIEPWTLQSTEGQRCINDVESGKVSFPNCTFIAPLSSSSSSSPSFRVSFPFSRFPISKPIWIDVFSNFRSCGNLENACPEMQTQTTGTGQEAGPAICCALAPNLYPYVDVHPGPPVQKRARGHCWYFLSQLEEGRKDL